MEFKLTEKKLPLGPVANQYADVHFHIEDREEKTFSTLKANKVILALHSPYFHRLFQSSEKSETFHVCLAGVANHAIHDAVKLMYGEQLTMQEKHVKRFSAFLKSIEIEVESQEITVQNDYTSNVVDAKEDEHIHKKKQLSPSKRKTKPEQSVVKKQKLSADKTEPARQSPSLSPSPSMQLIEEADSSSSKLLRKQSSSSESVTITNRKGGLASLDNWTETSDADLESIDFKMVAGSSKETHDDYVCDHCNFRVKTFAKATQHFINNHQKGDAELKVIEEVMEFKKSATCQINKLQTNIGDGCNKTLATSKLETIIDDLEQHVDRLRSLNVKNLSPNLKTKRNVLIQGINDAIKKVKTFIENL